MNQQTTEKLQQLITTAKSKANIDAVITNASQYNEDNLTKILDILVEQPTTSNWFINTVIDMIANDKFNNGDLDNLMQFCAEIDDNGRDIVDALYYAADIDARDYTDGDDYAYTYDELYEIADEDLKTNGMNANALYWYNELQSDALHVFNGYANGFYTYDTMDEYLNDYIPQYGDLIDDLIDYLAE